MSKVWRVDSGLAHWVVTLDGAQVEKGSENDQLKAKRKAFKAMTRISSGIPRK
jgi:hypothetical protein